MINKILTKGIMPLVAAICLLPASGFASQIFSMPSGPTGGSSLGTGSSETLMVDFNTLTSNAAGSPCAAGCTGTNEFVETYSNSTGDFVLTQSGTTILSWQNSTPNIVVNGGGSFNLYSTPTNLTFTSAFLTELGLGTSPTLATLPVALQTIDVAFLSNGNLSSATSQMTLTSTPEPATFAMFGIALLLGLGYKARKRLA